ncbi:MAG: TonB-dependent receptor plug domain-containing protein, partial [Opitutus sp.]
MTTPTPRPGFGVRRVIVSLFALSSAAASFAQQASAPAGSDPTRKQEEVIVLTPFTVDASQDKGYFAENTLAGSRIRTNLGDLAAAITVVTKQQMEDTAALDINDVFKYEASTEGSSTYTPSIVDRGTAKDAVAGYSFGNNGDTTTNAQSNRIRGLAAPDAAINNYSTANRIPFDAYNAQSIEISRGPNSLLFGLGSPSGVVNTNYAQAVMNRDKTSVQLRGDQNGSFRASLSFNRGLIDDKLSIFGAVLYDNRQFERKPSYDRFRRQYGAITYKPLKNTTIRAFAEGYQNDANRPNSLTPRDQVTPWLTSGRPVYDPVTRSVTLLDTGVVKGPYVTSTLSPGYAASVNTILGAGAVSNITSPLFVPGIAFDDVGRPLRRVDTSGNTIDLFARSSVFYRPAQTNPETALPSAATLGWVKDDPRFLIADRMWSASANVPAPIPTVNGLPGTYGTYNWAGVSNQSIYDWTKYNTLHTNFAKIRAENYNVELEQQILPSLFLSAGWFRQAIDEVDNYSIGQLTGTTLSVDTNKNLLNGQPNPYFGLPYISEGVGGGLDTFYAPEVDDSYRVLLAYEVDFAKKSNWTRWLGRHRLLGLWSEQDVKKSVERWRLNFTDGDTDAKLRYTPNLSLANQNSS